MASVGISQAKLAALARLMADAGIDEKELLERFVRAQGPGGQHVNKTSTAVSLTHTPTNTTIKVQSSRSQALNRYQARKQLAELLLAQKKGEATKREQAAEKVRRQKRRRSRRAKNRMLDDKNKHAQKKELRRSPTKD